MSRNRLLRALPIVSASLIFASCGDGPPEDPRVVPGNIGKAIQVPASDGARVEIIAGPSTPGELSLKGSAGFTGVVSEGGFTLARIEDTRVDGFGFYEAITQELEPGRYRVSAIVATPMGREDHSMVRIMSGADSGFERADVMMGGNRDIVKTKGGLDSATLVPTEEANFDRLSVEFTVGPAQRDIYRVRIFPAVGRSGRLVADSVGDMLVGDVTLLKIE